MNERLRFLVCIVLIIAFVFGISICSFASQYQYGALKFVGFNNVAASSISSLIYSTFGSFKYAQETYATDAYGTAIRNSRCTLRFRTFAVTDTASYSTKEFFNFIGNNAMNLLMQYAFHIPGDYFTYASIDQNDTLHLQLSFTSEVPIDNIVIWSSLNQITGDWNGNGTSVGAAAIASWNINSSTWNEAISQNGNLYVINKDLTVNSPVNYIYIELRTKSNINTSNHVDDPSTNKITIDKSLVPFWDRKESAGGSPINNYYNITQNSTDLSGIYQYLDLISEWLDLIQETQGDTLDTLIDLYTDVMARLNTINNILNNINGNVSNINGNVSSILSILAGINDRINSIMNSVSDIEDYLTGDQYDILNSILQAIYDIRDTLYNIEDRFVEWTNSQSIGTNHTNMKTYISSIFSYIKQFFSAVFDFTTGLLSFSPFNVLSNFNGGNIFAN